MYLDFDIIEDDQEMSNNISKHVLLIAPILMDNHEIKESENEDLIF